VAGLIDSLGSFREGQWPIKVFPKGIPFPDGVVVHTLVERGQLEEFIKLILEHPRIDGLKVFPRGIPVPEWFAAEVEFR